MDIVTHCPACGFEAGKLHRCAIRIADGKLLRAATRYEEGPVGIFGQMVVQDFNVGSSPVEIANAAIAKVYTGGKYLGVVQSMKIDFGDPS